MSDRLAARTPGPNRWPAPDRPVTLYVSGAQSSGKSTLVEALLICLGGQAPDGPQMRQIVAGAYPGSGLSRLQPIQTFAAFMLRALGRYEVPQMPGLHLSDGSLLNDLAYLRGRIEVGAFGEASRIRDDDFSRLVGLFDDHVQRHFQSPACRLFVHLDPDLPLENDGYRPQYPPFHNFVNSYLLDRYRQLDLPHVFVTGPVAQRCEQVKKALIEHGILQHP